MNNTPSSRTAQSSLSFTPSRSCKCECVSSRPCPETRSEPAWTSTSRCFGDASPPPLKRPGGPASCELRCSRPQTHEGAATRVGSSSPQPWPNADPTARRRVACGRRAGCQRGGGRNEEGNKAPSRARRGFHTFSLHCALTVRPSVFFGRIVDWNDGVLIHATCHVWPSSLLAGPSFLQLIPQRPADIEDACS